MFSGNYERFVMMFKCHGLDVKSWLLDVFIFFSKLSYENLSENCIYIKSQFLNHHDLTIGDEQLR